jgi:OmcA/MtrC family decaheme c-type cytochrome
MTATVTGVTVAPLTKDAQGNVTGGGTVVNFKLATKTGVPVIGFGTTSKSSTATAASYPNLAFSLAKLIPGSGGQPSRWVSYMITTVPVTTTSSTCTVANAVCLTRPSTDNTGLLTDNKDGSYTYRFYRDPTATKAQVDGITPPANTATANYDKAKLDDLTYVDSATHRLTIQISGNAPGTGTNTATGADSGVSGVPLKNAVDVVYDFVPATGQPPAAGANRLITTTSNCNACHSTLGGLPGGDPEANAAGFHGGGRNNVDYCVVCHTGQRSWGRVEAPYDANTLQFLPSGTPPAVTTYMVDGKAVGNLVNMIHKTHLGKFLARKNYNYAEVEFNEVGYPQDTRNCQNCHTQTTATPQGNNWLTAPSRLACGACHDGINFDTGTGVTLADAWAGKTVSTGFNGKAHPANATDAGCTNAGCHGVENGVNKIDLAHIPVTPPAAGNALASASPTANANTNSAWIASGASSNRLPAGAIKVTYDVKEVGRTTPGKNPYITFRMLANGVVTQLNVFATAPVNPATGDRELWTGFMGAPSVYFVWSVPQDGILKNTQDFNVSVSGWLKSIWNAGKLGISGAAANLNGTLTGPDSSGYYTATLTSYTVPDSAAMLTGGLGYTYNVTNALPLTQTNLQTLYPTANPPAPNPNLGTIAQNTFKTGGLIVIAPNVQKVATKGCPTANNDAGQCVLSGTAVGSYLPRRVIVADAKCNACHQELGTFTEDAFHAGQRNDGTTCSWCHRPAQTSSGWSADSTAFVHAIHGAAKRSVPYTWHATQVSAGPPPVFEDFAEVAYPGILSNCEQCHVPGSYNFANADSQAAVGLSTTSDGVDKRPWRTVGVGYYMGVAGDTLTTYSYSSGSGTCVVATTSPSTQTALGVFSLSPYVTADGKASGAGLANTGTYYGYGFSYNALATVSNSCSADGTVLSVPAGGTLQAAPATLVTSPTTAACTGCHDSNLAISHMRVNGGTFYESRTIASGKTEQCMVCHSSGRTADTRVVHGVN